MSQETGYRIDVASVTHEEIEGEVIAVNLVTGCYYSLRGTAATVWKALETPRSADQVGAALAARHDDLDAAPLTADVQAFLRELEQESLVGPAPPAGGPVVLEAVEAAPYEKPVLARFDDLQDLLVLDPVHDVGDEGWPAAPKQG